MHDGNIKVEEETSHIYFGQLLPTQHFLTCT